MRHILKCFTNNHIDFHIGVVEDTGNKDKEKSVLEQEVRLRLNGLFSKYKETVAGNVTYTFHIWQLTTKLEISFSWWG